MVFGTNPTLTGATIADANNIVFGTSTGTKIGTATIQKLGFYNATPIVQPTGSVKTALSNLGLIGSPTITLASSDFANQGTTTTVLHGNASGNPSFGAVTASDMSLAANSINVNATGSTAAPTAATWLDVAEQTYGGTFSNWVGTTAPSGTQTASYRWTQVGKTVTVYLWARWATGGTAITSTEMTLPSDIPLPAEPATFNATNDVMYVGVCNMAGTGNLSANGRISLVKTGTSAYKFHLESASSSAKNIQFTFTYSAQ
jgi:hypothetical protein